MITRIIILIAISIIFSSTAFTQNDKKTSFRKQRKINAKEQIIGLKNGILLVRLKTNKKSIEAMREHGRTILANKTEGKLKNRNAYIIYAFKTSFDFCPVYFFYSSDSKHIRNNHLDSVSFLNDSLKIDKSITVNDTNYYVAEFGHIEPTETIDYQSSVYVPKKETRNTYTGSSDFSFKAVIVKDKMFKQLNKPFPYYSKESSSPKKKENINAAITKLNLILKKYYTKIYKELH
ncbi:MAG: hypothetical protein JKY30_03405 [Flavobacteriales bacterium]|nr:hypothetical protein [Flavobacteriales bacterium]